jgi:hypothetical protein
MSDLDSTISSARPYNDRIGGASDTIRMRKLAASRIARALAAREAERINKIYGIKAAPSWQPLRPPIHSSQQQHNSQGDVL